jgi:hypothetical protein
VPSLFLPPSKINENTACTVPFGTLQCHMATDILQPLKNLLATAETHCQDTHYVQGYRDGLRAAIDLVRITQLRVDLELANEHFNRLNEQPELELINHDPHP